MWRHSTASSIACHHIVLVNAPASCEGTATLLCMSANRLCSEFPPPKLVLLYRPHLRLDGNEENATTFGLAFLAVQHVHTSFQVCFLLHKVTGQRVSSWIHDRVVEVGAEVVSEMVIAESLLFMVVAGENVIQLTRRKR